MGIDLQTQFHFSQARWDKLQRSTNISDATYMGFFDRIKDYLRGGVKRQALEKAYETLRSSRSEGEFANGENLLEHFFRLRLAMRPEFAKECSLKVVVDQDTWSYEMRTPGSEEPFATGTNLPIGSGYTLGSFQDFEMLTKVSDFLQGVYRIDAEEQIERLHSQFQSLSIPGAAAGAANPDKSVLHKFGLIVSHLSALGVPPQHLDRFSLDVSDTHGLLKIGSVQIAKIALKDLADLKDLLRTHATLAAALATKKAAVTQSQDVVKMMTPVFEGGLYEPARDKVRPDDKMQDAFFCKENFIGFGNRYPMGVIEAEAKITQFMKDNQRPVERVTKKQFAEAWEKIKPSFQDSLRHMSRQEAAISTTYHAVKLHDDLDAPLRERRQAEALDQLEHTTNVYGAEPTFEAWFSDGAVEQCLVFSDEFAAPGELRGDVLQAELERGSYTNLEDIVQNYVGMGSKSAAMSMRTAHETIIRQQLDELSESSNPPWPFNADELDEFRAELTGMFA